MSNTKPHENLYNALNQQGYDIGDLEQFTEKLKDAQKRHALYDTISTEFNVGDFDNFENVINYLWSNEDVQPISPSQAIPQPLQENIAIAKSNPMDKVNPALRTQSTKPIGDVQTSQNIGHRAEMTFNTPEQRSAAQVIADNDAIINSPSLIDSKDPKDPIKDALSQDLIDQAASQEWQRDTLNSVSGMREEAKKKIKERAEELRNSGEDFDYSQWQQSPSQYGYAPMTTPGVKAPNLHSDREMNLYRLTIETLNEAQKHMETVRENQSRNGFQQAAAGIGDAIFDIDTLTLGLDSLAKNATLKAILDKADTDQPLTQAEESLLNAALYKQFTEAALPNGRWYNVGKGIGEQVPYMLEFALSGGVASALTKGASKAIGKQVVKYINNLALKNGSKIAKRSARNVFTRGSRMLGNTLYQLPGGVMRAAVQVPLRSSVYNDIIERQIGTLGYNPGEDGTLDYTGRINADNTADAITKGLTSGFITNLTESIGGEGIQFITNKIGGLMGKGINAVAKDFRSPRWYNRLRESFRRNGFGEFVKATSWQGPVAEYGEEILDQTLNAIFVGDSSLDPNSENYVFDLDNLIDTAITTGAISLFMGAAGGVASGKIHRDVNKAYALAERNLRTLHYTDTEINALNNIATSRPQEASKWVSSITRTMRTLAIRSAEIENSLSPEARTLLSQPYTDAEFNELSPYDQQAVMALAEINNRFNELTIQRDYVVAGINYNALSKGLKESVAPQAEAVMADIQANALRDSDYTINVRFKGQDGYLVSGTADIDNLPDGRTVASLPAGNIYQVRTKSPDGQWIIQQAVAEDIVPGIVTPTQQLIEETTARIYTPVQNLINAEQAQAQAEVAQSTEQTTPTTEQTELQTEQAQPSVETTPTGLNVPTGLNTSPTTEQVVEQVVEQTTAPADTKDSNDPTAPNASTQSTEAQPLSDEQFDEHIATLSTSDAINAITQRRGANEADQYAQWRKGILTKERDKAQKAFNAKVKPFDASRYPDYAQMKREERKYNEALQATRSEAIGIINRTTAEIADIDRYLANRNRQIAAEREAENPLRNGIAQAVEKQPINTIEQYIARYIALGGRLRMTDQYTNGLAAELGITPGSQEHRELLSILSNTDGMTPEQLAEYILENVEPEYAHLINGRDTQDIRNAIIETIAAGVTSRKKAYDFIADINQRAADEEQRYYENMEVNNTDLQTEETPETTILPDALLPSETTPFRTVEQPQPTVNDTTQAKLAHIASWQQAIDVPIVIFHDISEVDNPQAVANIQAGNRTPGWIANDTVYIYLPHAINERDIDETIMHECIAHFGIPRLFSTQEQANTFYDEVWNAMPEAEQYRFLSYPGVSHLKGEKARRVAADEYIAHLAEQIRAKRAGEAEVSLWQRIVAFFRNALRRANVNLRLNDTDLTQLLLQSLDALKKNNEQPKETTPDNALDPNEVAVTLPSNGTETRFSIRSFREEGRAKVTKWLDNKVADKDITRQEAQDILDQLDTIYDICQEYTTQYAPFGDWSEAQVNVDANGNPVLSVIKSNGEYAMNLDFSLVCKKRRTLDAVFQEMIARDIINDFELDGVQVAKVNEIIRSYGFETACRICFVDSKRFRIAAVADTFVKLYNELSSMSDRDLRKILSAEPKTVRGKAAQLLLNDPSQRIKVSRSDFMSAEGFERIKRDYPAIMKLYNAKKGSGGPKASFGDVQYLNDIENTSWTPDKAYAVGGVRLQSFSDYVPRMVFDYVQMIADLAAKRLPVHAYTKEDIFAKQFGLTGIKINLSLVPRVDPDGMAPGLDRDGNYVWQEGETFPYEDAIALQNAPGYRDNCGTIAVGVSDAHILKMLDDENIRMVIPYHKSGLNPAVAKFNRIGKFVDYTLVQSTRYANGKKLSNEDLKTHFNFNEALRKAKGNPRIAAQQYLDWCRNNNYLPKFDKFASHPNYYKLLEDFTTMYTVDGVDTVVPQRAVEMRFPTEQDAFGSMRDLIAEGLEADAILEGQRNEQLPAIVDEIAATLPPKTQAKTQAKTKTTDTRFRIGDNEQTTLLNAKQPKTSQPLVDTAISDTRFRVTKRTRETINTWLNKRTDLDNAERNAFWTYIENEEPAKQLAMGKWFANGSIRLPEDQPTVDDAMRMARKMNVDPLKYNAPGLITSEYHERFGTQEQKEKILSPEDERFAGILTDKVDYGNGITVYTVQDDAVGQDAVRELMNDHLGKNFNCWCLLYADANGNITESARNTYWKHYDSIPKRVAFKDGKICSFCASDNRRTQWWDLSDRSHGDNIPVEMELPGDSYGRRSMYGYNEKSNKLTRIKGYHIFRGNKKNGRYEEWYNEDPHSLAIRANYKGGKLHGLYEEWHYNGKLFTRGNHKDGKRDGLYEEWHENGKLRIRENYKDGEYNGLREVWHLNGQLTLRVTFKGGERDGLREEWYDNGQPRVRANYKGGKLDGLYEEWYKNGQLQLRENYKDGKYNGLHEEWYDNGQLESRTNFKNGYPEGIGEAWHENGQLAVRNHHKDNLQDGLYEEWAENGQLTLRENYKNGKLDGLREEWTVNGQLWSSENYKDGELISEGFNDKPYKRPTHFRSISPGESLTDYARAVVVNSQQASTPTGINTPVALATANDKNKLPDTPIRFRMTRRTESTVNGWINRRTDLSDAERKAVIDHIDNLDGTTLQLATAKWFAQGTIRIPEDNIQVEQAIKVASRAKVDPLAYDYPQAIISAFPDMKPKGKPINPDDVPTLTNKQELPNGLTVYNVDESRESQQAIRDIIDTHLGTRANPWCITSALDGNLTDESWEYWESYAAYPKRIAFHNGKVVALFASDSAWPIWWDTQDRPHYGIPLGANITDGEYNEETNTINTFNEDGEIISSTPADTADDVINTQSGTRFRVVEDADTRERFDREIADGNFVKTYRSMVLIDGELYPPMFSKTEKGNKSNPGQLRQPSHEGDIEQSEEDLSKATLKNGKYYITLIKDNNKETRDVAYNPYLHTASSPLNDQFKEAQDRPNMVTVEMYIPLSELTSGYQAEGAHDPVGWKPWPSGILRKYIDKPRKVLLTQRGIIHRIVPDSEVASLIDNDINGNLHTLPTNVFTPSVRAELEKLGYRFINTNNAGKITEGQFAGLTYSAAVAQDPEYFGYKPNPTPPKGGKSKDSTSFRSINHDESLSDYARAVVANKQQTTEALNKERIDAFARIYKSSLNDDYFLPDYAIDAIENAKQIIKNELTQKYGSDPQTFLQAIGREQYNNLINAVTNEYYGYNIQYEDIHMDMFKDEARDMMDDMLEAWASQLISTPQYISQHIPQQVINATIPRSNRYNILSNDVIETLQEVTGESREQIIQQYSRIGDDMLTDEDFEAINSNPKTRFRSIKETAPETVSVPDEHHQTVVSSADGAKILKDIDNAIKQYANDSITKEKTFIGNLAKILGAKKHGSNSQYATFEAVNGKVFTIRLANHNTKVSTFDNHNESEGISIVISPATNTGTINDGDAHIVEYFYNAIKLRKADGKPLVEILKSIKQSLYSGQYIDTTGLAEREEVNKPTSFRSIAADTRTADTALDSIEQATADYADSLDNERQAIIDAITPAPGDSLRTIAEKTRLRSIGGELITRDNTELEDFLAVANKISNAMADNDARHKHTAIAESQYDSMQRLHNLIDDLRKQGALIDERFDPWLTQNQARSRAQAETKVFDLTYRQPLYEAIARGIRALFPGINTKDKAENAKGYSHLSLYAQARTAVERQAIKSAQARAEAEEKGEEYKERDFGGLAGIQEAIFGLYSAIDDKVEAVKGNIEKLTALATERGIPTVQEYIDNAEAKLGNPDTNGTAANQLWNAIRSISAYQLTYSYNAGLTSRTGYQTLTYGRNIDALLREKYDMQVKQIKDNPGSYDNVTDYDKDGNATGKRMVLNDNARIALNKLNQEYAQAIDAVPMPGKNGNWQQLIDTGWLTEEDVNSLHRYYMYYMPLKGHAELTAEDIVDYENKTPRNQSKIKAVEGHSHLAKDPFNQLILDTHGAIQNAEQNRWRLNLYNILTNNPNPSQYVVEQRFYKIETKSDGSKEYVPYGTEETINGAQVFIPGRPTAEELANGTAVSYNNRFTRAEVDIPIRNDQRKEHSVTVMVDGEAYTIFFYDKRIADAINGTNIKRPWKQLEKLQALNRLYAGLKTSLNPTFTLISNLPRDWMEMVSNNLIEHGLAHAVTSFIYRVRATRVGDVQAALRKYQDGKLLTLADATSDVERYVVEFFNNGGSVNITQLPDYNTAKVELMDDLNTYMRTGEMPKGNALAREFNNMAERVELAPRLATYIASRTLGRNISQSVNDAKEATVNFDRKGSWSGIMGMMQLFYNASAQSVRRQIGLARRHPVRFAATYATIGLLSPLNNIMMSYIMSMLLGDDDDLENIVRNYFAINPELRRRYNIILIGNDYIRIPMAVNYLPYVTLGDVIANWRLNPNYRPNVLKDTLDIAAAILDTFLPSMIAQPIGFAFDAISAKNNVESANASRAIVFSLLNKIPVIEPLIQAVGNYNFMGSTLFDMPYDKNSQEPAYLRARQYTQPVWVWASHLLNDITGGNDVHAGWLNIAPEQIENVMSVFGGYGEYGENIASLIKGGIEHIPQIVNEVIAAYANKEGALPLITETLRILYGHTIGEDDFKKSIPMLSRLYGGNTQERYDKSMQSMFYDDTTALAGFNEYRKNATTASTRADFDREYSPDEQRYFADLATMESIAKKIRTEIKAATPEGEAPKYHEDERLKAIYNLANEQFHSLASGEYKPIDNPYYTYMYIKDAIEKAPHRTTDGTYRLIDRSERSADSRGPLKQLLQDFSKTTSMYKALPSGYYPGMPLDNRQEKALSRFNTAVGKLMKAYRNTDLNNLTPADNAQ